MALKGSFDEMFSIELSNKFYLDAKKRFSQYDHIHLILGDSGQELPKLIFSLQSRCLFWLDAHYSGGETVRGSEDTPILKEISCILKDSKTHVILIDDMRLFGEDHGYPVYQSLVAAIYDISGNRYSVETSNDLMRITPNEEKA